MKPSVHIETSVLSYLTGRASANVIVAGRQALTAEWWETRRHEFDLYVSALVVTEAEDGDPAAGRRSSVDARLWSVFPRWRLAMRRRSLASTH